MPHDYRRMITETLCQLLVDDPHLFPVNRRGVAVIVTDSEKLPPSGLVHAEHLRVLVSQPFRPGAGGRRQDHADSFRIEPVDDLFHPVQPEHPFLRFQRGPCKNPQAHHVAAGFRQHFRISLQNIRPVQPLIRIVITAVKKHICLKLHFCILPFFHNSFLQALGFPQPA